MDRVGAGKGEFDPHQSPRELIRFGFSPLYIRYVDVWNAAETLRDVLVTGAWRRPEFQNRAAVT